MLTQHPNNPYASFTMAAPTGEGLPEVETITPLFDAMAELDLSVRPYLDACGNYATRPDTKNGRVVSDTVTHYINASHRFLLALVEDTPAEVYQETATRFLMEQDEQRVNRLNELLGTEALEKRDTPLVMVDTSGEPLDDEDLKHIIGSGVFDIHREGTSEDIRTFMNALSESPAALRLQRQEKIKGHLVDVGKIAVGTAFGTMAAMWLGHPRRPRQ